MKNIIIIILALSFSASFYTAQGQSIIDVKREIELKFQNTINSAKENVKQGRYDAAIDKYQEAITLKPENADSINAEIANVRRLKTAAANADMDERYKAAIASAEKHFDQGEYSQALQDYSKAFDIKPEKRTSFNSRIIELEELILEKAIADTEQRLENEYNNAIINAETSVTQRRYAEAKQNYITARELKPENADFINSKIAELEKPAQLHIYRNATKVIDVLEDGLSRLFPVRYDVIFDNKKVGVAKGKWKTTVTVDELETKTVWAAIDGRSAEVHIDFEPGRVYYVCCDVTSRTVKTGEYGTRKLKNGITERYEKTKLEYTPKLELVSVSVGEREFDSIKSK